MKLWNEINMDSNKDTKKEKCSYVIGLTSFFEEDITLFLVKRTNQAFIDNIEREA